MTGRILNNNHIDNLLGTTWFTGLFDMLLNTIGMKKKLNNRRRKYISLSSLYLKYNSI